MSQRSKRWTLFAASVSLLTAACLCTGGLGGGGGGDSSLDAPLLAQTHTNAAAGFTVSLPDGWQTFELGRTTLAANNQETLQSAAIIGPNIFITAGAPGDFDPGVSEPLDLLETEYAQEAIPAGISEVESFPDVTISGRPAAFVDFTAQDVETGSPLAGSTVAILTGEDAAVISVITPASDWSAFEDTFTAIVNSLDFQ